MAIDDAGNSAFNPKLKPRNCCSNVPHFNGKWHNLPQKINTFNFHFSHDHWSMIIFISRPHHYSSQPQLNILWTIAALKNFSCTQLHTDFKSSPCTLKNQDQTTSSTFLIGQPLSQMHHISWWGAGCVTSQTSWSLIMSWGFRDLQSRPYTTQYTPITKAYNIMWQKCMYCICIGLPWLPSLTYLQAVLFHLYVVAPRPKEAHQIQNQLHFLLIICYFPA